MTADPNDLLLTYSEWLDADQDLMSAADDDHGRTHEDLVREFLTQHRAPQAPPADAPEVDALAAVVAPLMEAGEATPEGLARAVLEHLGVPGQHVATFRVDGWDLEHPLTCRTGGRVLAGCPVHRAVCTLTDDGPPDLAPGRYVLAVDSDGALTIGVPA